MHKFTFPCAIFFLRCTARPVLSPFLSSSSRLGIFLTLSLAFVFRFFFLYRHSEVRNDSWYSGIKSYIVSDFCTYFSCCPPSVAPLVLLLLSPFFSLLPSLVTECDSAVTASRRAKPVVSPSRESIIWTQINNQGPYRRAAPDLAGSHWLMSGLCYTL